MIYLYALTSSEVVLLLPIIFAGDSNGEVTEEEFVKYWVLVSAEPKERAEEMFLRNLEDGKKSFGDAELSDVFKAMDYNST